MLTLTDQKKIFAAKERATQRPGELSTYVVARVRGNHLNGPVPVSVRYHWHFRYSDEWFDENGNSVLASSRDFKTAEERDFYIRTHFSTVPGGS